MEHTTGTFTVAKNISYILAAIVSLNTESYMIIGAFMIIDTITGVTRSIVVHGGRSFTSHAATLGITAKLLVILIPLLVVLAGQGAGINLVPVAKSALNILILSELYSILSNIQSVRLKRDVAEFDAVNFLLDKLRLFLEKTVKTPDQK